MTNRPIIPQPLRLIAAVVLFTPSRGKSRRHRLVATLVAATMLALIPEAAAGSSARSVFTTIDLAACSVVRRHRDGNSWRCPGMPGYPVYYAEGDLRAFVSVGAGAERRRAATQTLGPFNTIFPQGGRRATLEWRVVREGKRAVPYATILRYFTSGDGAKGEVVVVMGVGANDTCHALHIDANAAPEAMALARKLADETAGRLDCTKDPREAGVGGR